MNGKGIRTIFISSAARDPRTSTAAADSTPYRANGPYAGCALCLCHIRMWTFMGTNIGHIVVSARAMISAFKNYARAPRLCVCCGTVDLPSNASLPAPSMWPHRADGAGVCTSLLRYFNYTWPGRRVRVFCTCGTTDPAPPYINYWRESIKPIRGFVCARAR